MGRLFIDFASGQECPNCFSTVTESPCPKCGFDIRAELEEEINQYQQEEDEEEAREFNR